MVLMVIGVPPGHKGRIGHHDHTHFIGQTPGSSRRSATTPQRTSRVPFPAPFPPSTPKTPSAFSHSTTPSRRHLMSGSPLDPLVDLVTHLAITIGGIALATLSTVAFTRWLRLHWSWTLPGVLLFSRAVAVRSRRRWRDRRHRPHGDRDRG